MRLVFVPISVKVQLGRLCTGIVECYATVKIPQQTVMRMKYDMVLKEKLMTNSFARHFAAQVKKKNQGGELYMKLAGLLMKASGVLNGQLLYRFERRKKSTQSFHREGKQISELNITDVYFLSVSFGKNFEL